MPPSAAGPAWRTPRDRGKEGEVRGFVISSLPARRTRATGSRRCPPTGFPLFPVDCSTLVPGMSGRISVGRVRRDSVRAVAELRRVLIGVRWERGGHGCLHPSQPGEPTSTARGGAGRDT
jgi:hypothetical protein